MNIQSEVSTIQSEASTIQSEASTIQSEASTIQSEASTILILNDKLETRRSQECHFENFSASENQVFVKNKSRRAMIS